MATVVMVKEVVDLRRKLLLRGRLSKEVIVQIDEWLKEDSEGEARLKYLNREAGSKSRASP